MKDITAGRLQRLLANLNKEIAPLEAVFNEVDRKYHIRNWMATSKYMRMISSAKRSH
ncbi:hypothetical protein V7183_03740 [Bacillus sp. JJ1127]|uniref:hypothetical protein n=1 Tax=Bacillus sp. JJ1127 TaxID=3122952 RepID=UPI002FFE4BF7